jgi:iron complex transport system substrate-binding protein
VPRRRALCSTLSWAGISALAALGCTPVAATPRAALPARVVALAPNLAEIAADIGAAPRLVGVSSYGSRPRGADSAVAVGGFTDPSIERIIALRPDLVLGVPLQRPALDSCAAAGLRTLEVPCQTVDDVIRAYEIIGRTLGLAEAAGQRRDELLRRLEAIRATWQGRTRPRTLFLLGLAGDDLRQVFPVARGNFGDELLEIAGGRNVLERQVPAIGVETVVALAPEVIVEVAMDSEGGAERRRDGASPFWSRLGAIPAVQSGRVHSLEASSLLVPGPRIADGAALLAGLLHPDLADAPP